MHGFQDPARASAEISHPVRVPIIFVRPCGIAIKRTAYYINYIKSWNFSGQTWTLGDFIKPTVMQWPSDATDAYGGGVGGWGREWEAVGREAYHEVGPHGEPLAVVDLLHTQLGGHVIIGGLISDAPAHVHHLPDTGDTQVIT